MTGNRFESFSEIVMTDHAFHPVYQFTPSEKEDTRHPCDPISLSDRPVTIDIDPAKVELSVKLHV